MHKLIVSGCSWSAGTWKLGSDNQSVELDHGGFAELLNNHPEFSVVNLSQGGYSVWQALSALQHYSYEMMLPEGTKFVLFQTDVLRPWGAEEFDVPYNDIVSNAQSLDDLYTTMLEYFYYKLSVFGKQHDVYLAGALTDVHTALIESNPEFSDNIKVLTPSWIKLLDGSHTESTIPLVINKLVIPEIKPYISDKVFDEIFSWSDSNFVKFQMLHKDQIGSFPKDFHPNIRGHQTMANFIEQYFLPK